MQADDYKFNVEILDRNINEISDKEVLYDDYQTAMDAATQIIDSLCESKKENNSHHVYIGLIAILYNTDGTIKDRWLEKELYHKTVIL